MYLFTSREKRSVRSRPKKSRPHSGGVNDELRFHDDILARYYCFLRFKTMLISSLVQPALWMAFFGIAMSANFDRLSATIPPIPGVPQVPYLTYMAAGVIAMTTLFTSLFGGIVLLFDKNWGP